jgi:hypothetical protein
MRIIKRFIIALFRAKGICFDEKRDLRLECCFECDEQVKGMCNKCKCFVVYKTEVEEEYCPLFKW